VDLPRPDVHVRRPRQHAHLAWRATAGPAGGDHRGTSRPETAEHGDIYLMGGARTDRRPSQRSASPPMGCTGRGARGGPVRVCAGTSWSAPPSSQGLTQCRPGTTRPVLRPTDPPAVGELAEPRTPTSDCRASLVRKPRRPHPPRPASPPLARVTTGIGNDGTTEGVSAGRIWAPTCTAQRWPETPQSPTCLLTMAPAPHWPH